MRLHVEDLRLEGLARGPLCRGLHVALAPDRVLLVVGGSGSGKTRFLKALAGSTRPLTGCVRCEGTLRVGLALGRGGLLMNSTVMQNLTLPLRFQGMKREDAVARGREALAQFGLPDVEDLRPHALSDRQRKLASLSRVLAFDPDLVLLDEPLEGLDPRDFPRVKAVMAAWAGDPAKLLVVATEHPEAHGELEAQHLDLEDDEERP